jgi:hypothetical protein
MGAFRSIAKHRAGNLSQSQAMEARGAMARQILLEFFPQRLAVFSVLEDDRPCSYSLPHLRFLVVDDTVI